MSKKSSLVSRLIVAAWGIPLLLGSTYFGGWWFTGLISVVSIMALLEFYKLQEANGIKPLRALGIFSAIVILLGWIANYQIIGWLLMMILIVHLMFALLLQRQFQDAFYGFLGVCYVPLLAGSFIFIRAIGFDDLEADFDYGRWLAFAVWGSIWICDTAAYFGGSKFGKTLLAPKVSPKKTVEGFIFGLFGALLFGVAMYFLNLISLDEGLAIGIIAGTFGQIGDLAESKIKRDANVKDSGTLLPGHGGILDRFDSLLFTAPIFALYLMVAEAVKYH